MRKWSKPLSMWMIGVFAMVLALSPYQVFAGTEGEVTCDRFHSQEEAKQFAEDNPELKETLDPEGNGVICEELPKQEDGANGDEGETEGKPGGDELGLGVDTTGIGDNENGNDGADPTGDDQSGNAEDGQTDDTVDANLADPVHIKVAAFPPESEDGVQGAKVKAQLDLLGGQEAAGSGIKGDWTFTAVKKSDGSTVDEESKEGVEGDKAGTVLDVTEQGEYTINVAFHGTIDGVEIDGEGSAQLTIPEAGKPPLFGDGELKTGYSFKNGKHILTTTMLNAEKAHGEWGIIFGREDAADLNDLFSDVKEGHDGVIARWEFDKLKPGHYYGIAVFEGKADGKVTALLEEFEFTVKEDGTIQPDPGNGGDGGKIDPKEGKKHIEDIKGGKMPDTATDYPLGVLAGILALALGAGAWKLRAVMNK